jgi:hypothetical protein
VAGIGSSYGLTYNKFIAFLRFCGKIINLALEVDLNLGASLTSSITPELQQIIVDGID